MSSFKQHYDTPSSLKEFYFDVAVACGYELWFRNRYADESLSVQTVNWLYDSESDSSVAVLAPWERYELKPGARAHCWLEDVTAPPRNATRPQLPPDDAHTGVIME